MVNFGYDIPEAKNALEKWKNENCSPGFIETVYWQ